MKVTRIVGDVAVSNQSSRSKALYQDMLLRWTSMDGMDHHLRLRPQVDRVAKKSLRR
jgi:hypothetical protein